MNMDETLYLQDLMAAYKKRLRVLELQAAAFGANCPAHIQVEIADAQEKTRDIEQKLKNQDFRSYPESSFTFKQLDREIDGIEQGLREIVVKEQRVYRFLGIPIWSVTITASHTILILCLIVLWSSATGAQDELAQARADLTRVSTELNAARVEQQQVAEVLSQAETLAALTGSGGSGAILRTPQGQTMLAARLPPLQPGRVYQLFLITGDNAPISGGTFTVSQQGHGLLALPPTQEVLSATRFVVTDEPGPSGSPGPTTDPLIVGSIPS
jgi:hypothetical protein